MMRTRKRRHHARFKYLTKIWRPFSDDGFLIHPGAYILKHGHPRKRK
jgi:hypothetical protein